MEIQRKAFEAYMADRYKNTVDQRVCINSDGDYMAWDMQVAWHVWQAAKAQEAVPDGFVVVPKEPTDAMLFAASGRDIVAEHYGDENILWPELRETWKAMIEAQEPTND